MNEATKRYVRQIVRQVHPDLFSAHPYERAANSESLKALNAYADTLSRGQRPVPATVEFYVRDGGALVPVRAELPAYGSLGPLFAAFGLVTEEELRAGWYSAGGDDRDLAAWLAETVGEAVRAADSHDALKRAIRGLRGELEGRFHLAGLQVGGEFAVTGAEQARQLEALRTLRSALDALAAEDPARFAGLTLRLYHPESCPLDTLGFTDADGSFSLRTGRMASHVADDGILHVVAEPGGVLESLEALDLARARLLSRLSSFWGRRSRDLAAALQGELGVEAVWCDTRTEDAAQRFVLWAGAVLEQREHLRQALGGRRYGFSLLAHSDAGSPLLDFLATSSVLQVRCDCPPSTLLDFLLSEAGGAAHASAARVADGRAQEAELLEAARQALGARHLIRVCASYEQDKVLSAAQRLIEAAPSLRAAADLSGVSLAIDDCYEVWESGFVSIPYDFALADLRPQLLLLLGAGKGGSGANGSGNGGAGHGGSEPYAANGNGNGVPSAARAAQPRVARWAAPRPRPLGRRAGASAARRAAQAVAAQRLRPAALRCTLW